MNWLKVCILMLYSTIILIDLTAASSKSEIVRTLEETCERRRRKGKTIGLRCLTLTLSKASADEPTLPKSESVVCPRKPHLIGSRNCRKQCTSDDDCRGRKKKCVCDDVCGLACLNPRGRCPRPKLINGRAEVDGKNQLGAVVKYSCDNDYRLDGPETRICNGERDWSGLEPRCVPISASDRLVMKTAEQPQNIESGSHELSIALCSEPPSVQFADHDGPKQDKFMPRSEVSYTCRNGYIVDGIDLAICMSNGQWAGPMMVCREVQCADLGDLPNGVMYGDAPYSINSKINYECRKGFRLIGSPTLSCKSTGNWDRSKPVCQKTSEDACSSIRAPRHGSKIGRSTSIGSVVTFVCDVGYKIVGTAKRRCEDDTTWSGSDATCEPIDCGDPGPLYNGYIEGTRFTFGSIIKYRCIDGAKFDGLTYSASCRENGEWSFPKPRCLRSCTRPDVPEAQLFLGSRDAPLVLEHGSRLNVVCEAGLAPSESSQPICNNGTWLGIPRCVQGGCDSRPEDIANGIALYRSTRSGDRVRYRCNTGHKLVGDQYLICEVGEWKGTLPHCKPVFCQHPGDLDNGRILLVGYIGKFEYRPYVRQAGHGEKIEYYCNTGFRLEGPSAATCIDGDWSPDKKPHCVDNQHPILPGSAELYST